MNNIIFHLTYYIFLIYSESLITIVIFRISITPIIIYSCVDISHEFHILNYSIVNRSLMVSSNCLRIFFIIIIN